jgi:putative glutamine amidotransferase
MRPVIGITCDFDWETGNSQLRPGYFEGVYRSGGLPFLIPVIEPSAASQVISKLDGLLLTGGSDVDPYFFNMEPHPALGRVNPYRDELELTLCREARQKGLPVFGICRGVQLMNVAMGGDLYQDIAAEMESDTIICHDQQAPKWYGSHEVTIKEGTRLQKILGTEKVRANSFHHQAIRQLGRSLYPSAYASDGTIEAVECDDNSFFLGVQWHPERMLEDKIMIKLFEAFVKEAAGLSIL